MPGDVTPPELYGLTPVLAYTAGRIMPACRAFDPGAVRRRTYQVIDVDDPDWYLRTLAELIVTQEVDRRSCVRTSDERTLAVMEVTMWIIAAFDRYCSRAWWTRLARSTWLRTQPTFVRRAVSVHANVESRHGGDGVPVDARDAALRAASDVATVASVAARLGLGGPVGLYCELVAAGRSHTDALEVAGLLGVDQPA